MRVTIIRFLITYTDAWNVCNDAISKSRSDISGKCQTLKESLEKTAGTEKVGGDFSYRYCCFQGTGRIT